MATRATRTTTSASRRGRTRPHRRTLAVAALVATFALPPAGHAESVGFSVPESAGGFAGGAASTAATGLISNPAASAFGPRAEILLDTGVVIAGPTYTPATSPTGGTPSPVGYIGPAFNGSLAATYRMNKYISYGLAFYVPYGRGGRWPEEGPQRFHSISSHFRIYYVTPSAVFRPHPKIAVGAGLHLIKSEFGGSLKVDMASVLYSLDPSAANAPPPLQDPFLEGTMNFEMGGGYTASWILGVTAQPHPRVRLGLSYQPAVPITMRGRSRLVPSDDLALVSTGDYVVRLWLPPTVHAGARWHVSHRWTLGADVSWLGYSVFDFTNVKITHSNIEGSNTELNALMFALGTDDVDSLMNFEKRTARGGRNTWVARTMATARVGRRVRLGGQLGYEQHALSDEVVSPSTLDFDAGVAGLSAEVLLHRGWIFYMASTQYFPRSRTITNSQLDPFAPANTGKASPTGNGHYEVFNHRSSVGLRVSF